MNNTIEVFDRASGTTVLTRDLYMKQPRILNRDADVNVVSNDGKLNTVHTKKIKIGTLGNKRSKSVSSQTC